MDLFGPPAIKPQYLALTTTTKSLTTPLVHSHQQTEAEQQEQQQQKSSTIVYHGKRYLESIIPLREACFFNETLSSPSDNEPEKSAIILKSNTIVSRCKTQANINLTDSEQQEAAEFSSLSDSEYNLLSVSSPSSLSTDSI